jgi:AAA15 family ATPase/GTPase
MPTLTLEQFLSIDNAEVDLRRFTVLIGPQANGKSVIAKASYFFEDFLSKHFTSSIGTGLTKRELEKAGIAAFEEIFPRYAWGDSSFKLVYRIDEFELSITRVSGSKSPVKIDYPPELAKLHRKARAAYKAKRIEYESIKKEGRQRHRTRDPLGEILDELIFSTPLARLFPTNVFIPASRSFFANLQKNVFSFLANHISIDHLIKEFGSAYESAKWLYQNFSPRIQNKEEIGPLFDILKKDAESIIRGVYRLEDDQDWIVTNKRRINVANASSGQQEALPMLVVLLVWSLFDFAHSRQTRFFIEEPEAHLFPMSQKRIVDMLARIYSERSCSFVITTHSPYILTALNNLIMASNIVTKHGDAVRDIVADITQTPNLVAFADVSAYSVDGGTATSVLDTELGLIGASVVDAVSEEFGLVFERLLDVELHSEAS